MLDAPVSGSVITLEQGKLSVMVGGDQGDVRRRRPDPARHRPDRHVRRRQRPGRAHEDRDQSEPRGADAGVQRGRAAGREGRDITRGRRQRADEQRDRLADGASTAGPFVLEMPEEAWFDCNMMQKDMVLALDLGRELDVPLPTTAAIQRDPHRRARDGPRPPRLRRDVRRARAPLRAGGDGTLMATRHRSRRDDGASCTSRC